MMSRIISLLFFVLVTPVLTFAEVFVVSHGDTPSKIANSHSVPLSLLKKANPDFDWIHLKTGDRVNVPGRYQVQPGDTLYSLSRQWRVDVSTLVDWNRLAGPSGLKSGQVLYYPDTSQPQKSPAPVSPSPPDSPPAKTPTSPSLDVFWPVEKTPHRENDRLKSVTFLTQGEPFRSVSSGTVVFLGEFRGVGRVLLIQSSDGLVYAYGNFASAEVSFGQAVTKGAVLGQTSPRSGQKLRFFVFRNRDALDPFDRKK